MSNPKSRRKLAAGAKKTGPRRPGAEGLAAAAAKNRGREARLHIIDAFRRLGIPVNQWPAFVQAYYKNLGESIVYHEFMTPLPFQAPEFDRLNQSRHDWEKEADRRWELHRDRFFQQCEDWVSAGVDEEIVAVKRARGNGKNVPTPAGGRKRGDNTPINRRYEWAAKYLVKVPLKEIAGADAEATTVGRIAREIVRSAGWTAKKRSKRPRPAATHTS